MPRSARGSANPPANCSLTASRALVLPRPWSPTTTDCSASRRRERADLVIGAVPAGAVGRGRVELARPDAEGGCLDLDDGVGQVFLGRRVSADHVALEEPQFHLARHRARRFPPGIGVDLELEALGRLAVCVPLLCYLARLVVDDHRPRQVFVDPVVTAADLVIAEAEAELFLHVRRLDPSRLFLMPEARERLPPRRLARLLVLTREEALGGQRARARTILQDLVAGPCPLVGVEQLREWREVTGGAPKQVVLDGLVNDCPVGDSVVAEDRDPQHVHVFVLERTGLVVVDLFVADPELLAGRDWGKRLRGCRRRRIPLDLLNGFCLERSSGVLRQIERLQNELADLPLARTAVVARACQVELPPGARHTNIDEAPLLLGVKVSGG